MPKLSLTTDIVNNYQCPEDKKKIDLFDTQVSGLALEVRCSGGRTYYLRYKNKRSVIKLLKLGVPADLTLKQVRQLAQEKRTQIALGKDPHEEKKILKSVPTFATFIDEQYLPFIKSYKRSWATDVSVLKNHLLPAFGKKYLDEISRTDIIKVHQGRLDAGGAPGSANRLLIMMRYIYNLACEKWCVPGVKDNPTKGIPLFEENNKNERYLSTLEVQRLFEAVKASQNTMLQYIIPMLILTGARKQEVLKAHWQEFDVDARSWRIPMTKSGKARHVPLSDQTLRLLAEIKRRELGSPFVFPNPKTGRPYVSIFYAWDTARKNADLADVRIHDLRHTFASLLVNSGRTLYEVQKLLGHTQVKTTQRYAHLSHDTLIDASNAATKSLGDVFKHSSNAEHIKMPNRQHPTTPRQSDS